MALTELFMAPSSTLSAEITLAEPAALDLTPSGLAALLHALCMKLKIESTAVFAFVVSTVWEGRCGVPWPQELLYL